MFILPWPFCLCWWNTVQVLLISWWLQAPHCWPLIDFIPFLSLFCLHSCSRCNLDIISQAYLWLCHPWCCCIRLKWGREPTSELVSVSSGQEVCPRKVCVFAEWGDPSQITYLFILLFPGLPWLQVFWYQKGWLLFWWQYMFALSLTWQAICAPGHV